MKLKDLKDILLEGVILLKLNDEELPNFEEVYLSENFAFDESEKLEKFMENKVDKIYSYDATMDRNKEREHYTVVLIV